MNKRHKIILTCVVGVVCLSLMPSLISNPSASTFSAIGIAFFWIIGLILSLLSVYDWYISDVKKRAKKELEKSDNEDSDGDAERPTPIISLFK